jgi:prepilin-type N-terminal cleavage/methylation domain-containing protein
MELSMQAESRRRFAQKENLIVRKTNKKAGFTLVEIMIVVLIIGILMAIAVPNFVKARDTSRANSCVANLKQIDSAKEQWAMATNAASGATVLLAQIYPSYIKVNPVCAAGGTYTLNTIGTAPVCSIGATVTPNHILPS